MSAFKFPSSYRYCLNGREYVYMMFDGLEYLDGSVSILNEEENKVWKVERETAYLKNGRRSSPLRRRGMREMRAEDWQFITTTSYVGDRGLLIGDSHSLFSPRHPSS